MRKPWEIIQELEADNSRLAKEAIVQRTVTEGNDEFFRGARAALDAMITFGVKKVPTANADGEGLHADAFWAVAQELAERKLTGNAAQNTISALADRATQAEWNSWYRRILIKDLRCGVSEKTINSVVGKQNEKYTIPVFSCQLAHDGANHESKITGKKIIQVKLDGVRVVAIVYPNGACNLFSRNGKELVNFPHIELQFAQTASGIAEPMVFDGEVMSSSFQDLMKQVHRKSNVNANDAVLHLFDLVPLAAFQQGKYKVAQTARLQKLQDWKNTWTEATPNIQVLGSETVDLDTAAGEQRFKMINTQAVAGGYEGIMIKDLDAPYETKRTTAWLKRKPFLEVSLTVVGLEEGTGKNAGRLGALICEGTDDGKTIRTNVGSGLTDDLRLDIWSDQATVLGQVVEIRADATTRNQDSEDIYSLRFPRFIRFRGFEKGEKI